MLTANIVLVLSMVAFAFCVVAIVLTVLNLLRLMKVIEALIIEVKSPMREINLSYEESAVVDSDPVKLRAKREARVRKGEPAIDEEASQIITSKPLAQRMAEESIVKEAKLDKWMPDVKHGK